MKQISNTADDGVRAGKGVVVSLRDLGIGNVRLNFDDVAAVGRGAERVWQHQDFFTSSDYPDSLLRDMTLSDDQYRDIGIVLVARLLVLNERFSK